MSENKVWLITGAGRGLGVDIAKAALTAGHAVVATGRDATKVATAVGDHANLLAIKLDVTRPQDAEAAVEAAVAKFDRIDILVNNAGNFFAGFFEELRPEQVRSQIEMEGNGETRFGEGAHWLRFTQHAGSSGDDHMPSAV